MKDELQEKRKWSRQDTDVFAIWGHDRIKLIMNNGKTYVIEPLEVGAFNILCNIMMKDGMQQRALISKHAIDVVLIGEMEPRDKTIS